MAQRYLEKFASADDAISQSFPLNAYEWRSRQSVRNGQSVGIAMDYAFDHRRSSSTLVGLGQETVRAINQKSTVALLDQEVDDLRGKCLRIGRGKLYTIDETSTRRWCWARLAAVPEFTVKSGMLFHNVVSLRFIRYGDWFDTIQEKHIESLGGLTPVRFTVNNPGDLPVKLHQTRLRAGVTGYGSGNEITDVTRRGPAKARQFTGANSEYFNLADNAAYSTSDADFAWCGWIYMDSKSGTDGVFGKYTESGNQREYAVYSNATNLIFAVSSDGTAGNTTTVTSSVALATGAWFFFAVWNDSIANTINIEVNNGTAVSASHSGGGFDGTGELAVGRFNATNYFDGREDSLAFWKGRKLTKDEKTWLYNEFRGRSYSSIGVSGTDGSELKTDLIAWFDFDEKAGNAHDSHGSGGDLTDNASVTSAVGITDAFDGAREGDGLAAPDKSVGIEEATTNECENGGFESNTTNWTGVRTTIARVLSDAKFGAACLQLTLSSNTFAYAQFALDGTPNTGTYAISGWFKNPGAEDLPQCRLTATNGTDTDVTTGNFTLVAGADWVYKSVIYTTSVTDTMNCLFYQTYGASDTNVILIDGIQVEEQPIATSYIETDGGTAARSAARWRMPIADGVSQYFTETQGWWAARLAMGWANTKITSGDVLVSLWADDGNNFIELRYDTANNQWELERANGGSSSVEAFADTFSLAAEVTVICAWTATALTVSIDGAAFTSQADTNIPTLSATTIDIGSNAGSSEHIDSAVAWVAVGSGTLADADATTLNALGDTPPHMNTLDATAAITRVLTAEQLGVTGTAAFTNPKLINETTGYVFQSAQDGAHANHELRLDTEDGVVELSADDGDTYIDNFDQLTLPTAHPPLAFAFAPGDNILRYEDGGTPDVDIQIEYYPAYPS